MAELYCGRCKLHAIQGSDVNELYLTKAMLAAVLGCTKRTLTNYVSANILPRPDRHGRDVGWSFSILRSSLLDKDALTQPLNSVRQVALTAALNEMEIEASRCKDVVGGTDGNDLFAPDAASLPDGYLVADEQVHEGDQRWFLMEKLTNTKEVAKVMFKELKQMARNSQERNELWTDLKHVHDEVSYIRTVLDSDFIQLHGSSQLISARNFLTSDLFGVRNQNSERAREVQLVLSHSNDPKVNYVGPELRQDDGLVFMTILNIARDVKLGKKVSFSPQTVCEALWGSYSGPYRSRLKTIIQRLMDAVLHFEFRRFSAHLVQRFDYPNRGLWSVTLDKDIVQFMSPDTVVWLDLEKRLALGSGLASWLYGYVRSQSRLIPTKVQQLQSRCGSRGHLKTFRAGLLEAMRILARAKIVDAGWFLDRHDMLHWQTIPSA